MRAVALLAFLWLPFAAAQSIAETFQDLSARATAAREAGQIPAALGLYKQALQMNAQWQEGWWFLGTLSYDADQYSQARDAFHHFVELADRSAPAWGFLGLCEFETGEYQPALEHISRGLELGADLQAQLSDVLRFHRALLLTRIGRFDAAVQQYVYFVRKGAVNPGLLLGLGLAALHAPLVPKEVSSDRQDLYVMAGRAGAFAIAAKSAEAQRAFEDLLSRYPNATNVHYVYGCYLLPVDPDGAVAQLKREMEISPQGSEAPAMLAWQFLRTDQPDAALPYAKRAVQNEASSALAQYSLGRALAETGNPGKAIEHLEAAVKLDSDNPEYHISLASAYAKAGRAEEARRERQQSLELVKEAVSRAQS